MREGRRSEKGGREGGRGGLSKMANYLHLSST